MVLLKQNFYYKDVKSWGNGLWYCCSQALKSALLPAFRTSDRKSPRDLAENRAATALSLLTSSIMNLRHDFERESTFH